MLDYLNLKNRWAVLDALTTAKLGHTFAPFFRLATDEELRESEFDKYRVVEPVEFAAFADFANTHLSNDGVAKLIFFWCLQLETIDSEYSK